MGRLLGFGGKLGKTGYVVKTIENFYVRGSATFSKGTYTQIIQTLVSLEEGTSLKALINVFETQAKNMGAKNIVIEGVDIVNPKLFNPAIAQKLGYTFEKTTSNSIKLVKVLK